MEASPDKLKRGPALSMQAAREYLEELEERVAVWEELQMFLSSCLPQDVPNGAPRLIQVPGSERHVRENVLENCLAWVGIYRDNCKKQLNDCLAWTVFDNGEGLKKGDEWEGSDE